MLKKETMELWKKILLICLALVLLVLTVLGWGSIGGGICAYCLIMMGAALLVKKFLINREEDDWDME